MAASTLVETVVSGVLTGGATAATTIWGFFKTTKDRLEKLEAVIGKTGDSGPQSGVLLALHIVQGALKTLKERVDEIEAAVKKIKDREEWSAVGRIPTPMPFQLPAQFDDSKAREIMRRVDELEDLVKRLNRRLDTWGDDMDKLDERRTAELGRVREEMASVNGLLRGLMAAMDFDPRR